jgi:hypothetical protein
LLASDLDYYAIKTFDFDYDVLWVEDILFYYIDIDMCYWLSFTKCEGFLTSRMQRHRWNPLDSRSSQGVCHWGLIVFTVILVDLTR